MKNALPPFFTRADLLLIGAILAVSLALVIVMFLAREPRNGCYVVRVIGHTERDRRFENPPRETVTVIGPLGPTLVEWDSKGRFRIASSPCPNQICVGSGWTSFPNGVCCVPNGVVVEYSPTHPGIDGVTR